MTNRRDFLKTTAAAAIATIPVLNGCATSGDGNKNPSLEGDQDRFFIVPKDAGLPITGTFLDEISHDIPHQNWGVREWDADFRNMKAIGIDTVIIIRSG